ncbi:hypothetical protein Phum_PHUM420130 [Pediculus humanus corporis]|uniref:Uncharacterized protein n=1 Tax=Pediculus humanus subsp. corporis TaxID=121224 RepID=E0VSK9_PEDHC|nr:uncharacterized protein Phum_PHUM420130 [Pediculus humanus corporis]EEB16365.1 hypothetical protein Phum_PHUM420130 [Pediculus humanus corporis]
MNGANNKVLADMIDSPLGLSPMGNLTINFNESSLSSTPCYKINGRRLSMSSLTPNTPTSNNSLFDTSDGDVRSGSLIRRMNSAPSGSLLENSDVGQDGNNKMMAQIQKESSPLKNSHPEMSPYSRPIEQHDTESRDSGYAAEEYLPQISKTSSGVLLDKKKH